MNRKPVSLLLSLSIMLVFTACSAAADAAPSPTASATAQAEETAIVLSDGVVTVDGAAASLDASAAVYVGADIVYYESGRDETYGAGTDDDAHGADEAAAHTVVTITQPGVYRVSGALSQGQLCVDLGEEAAEDPGAVVALVLDGADITCTVAPAVLFYRVYECGSADTETASPTVDTTAAGANVVLADGRVNNISGSYVAKIYREGTDKKLHKYDGAFYSKMSMNVTGGSEGTGVLNITAENEGLDAELHLTINGGVINITAQNDGINTNEDGVSVTTINGGVLTIDAGLGAEGDGIDSNGYLVINGGTVTTAANGKSGDGGVDADLGVYLNGGTVVALGSRNDAAESASQQPFMELTFAASHPEGALLTVEDAEGTLLFSHTAVKEFSSATLSSTELAYGETYSVLVNGIQQQYTGTGSFGGPGGGMGGGRVPGGTAPDGGLPQLSEGAEAGTPPEGLEKPEGGDYTPPEGGGERPEGLQPGEGGERPGGTDRGQQAGDLEGSTQFVLSADSHSFSGVSDPAEAE